MCAHARAGGSFFRRERGDDFFEARGSAAERAPDTRAASFYSFLPLIGGGETQPALPRSHGNRRYQLLDLVLDSRNSLNR
jgi:hypothetical protein